MNNNMIKGLTYSLAIPVFTVLGVLVGFGVARAVPVGDTGPFSGPAGDQSDSAYFTDVAPVLLETNATATDDLIGKVGDFGKTVCDKLSQGFSEGELAAALAKPPNPTPLFLGQYVIHSAEWHFCPDRY
jgi:hypothetical protein